MVKISKILFAAAGMAVLLAGSGCGGLSGSHAVSPASLILPGLMQAEPPQQPPGEPPIQTLASCDVEPD